MRLKTVNSKEYRIGLRRWLREVKEKLRWLELSEYEPKRLYSGRIRHFHPED